MELQDKTYQGLGISPAILHNGSMASPTNQWSIAIAKITNKRKKTASDYEDIARFSFMGALYWDEGEKPIIPMGVVRGMLLGKGGASRSQRMGKQAELGIILTSDAEFIYDGPSSPKELWEDGGYRFDTMEKVGPSKVSRTRAIFREWKMVVSITYNPDFVTEEVLEHLMRIAGAQGGIGDRRPSYGRFTVE